MFFQPHIFPRVRLHRFSKLSEQGFAKEGGYKRIVEDRYVCRDSNDDRIPLDLSRRNPGAGRLLGAEWRKIGRNSAVCLPRSAGN